MDVVEVSGSTGASIPVWSSMKWHERARKGIWLSWAENFQVQARGFMLGAILCAKGGSPQALCQLAQMWGRGAYGKGTSDFLKLG